MLDRRLNLASLLWGMAVASPMPVHLMMPRAAGSANITLLPTTSPNVNLHNISNLRGTKDFRMYYDSDPNPNTDSMVSSVSASSAPHPIIQLEDTAYIKSVQCTNNAATIVFNDRNAYEAAVADWQQHDQFVLFSHNQNCGSGYTRGVRDYALVDSFKPANGSMTIEAAIEFVDYATAIGNETVVHVTLGEYKAPNSKRASTSHSMSWNEYPTNTLSTQQFGAGYQLANSAELEAICAGCGTAGDLTFTGEVDFSWDLGIKSVSVSLTGSMQATLALGLIANNLQGKVPIDSVQLASLTLPGFEIPEVVSFGPQIDLSAAASVQLDATGSALLGTNLTWSSIDIQLGLDGDTSQQATGLTPTANPTFQVNGTLSASLDLSLPVSMGVGINILDGKWNKQLAVVDTPTFALTGEVGTNGSTACSGVELSGALENSVGADIIGLTTISLASTSVPIFSTCLGGSSSAPTGSSSSPSLVSATATSTSYSTASVTG